MSYAQAAGSQQIGKGNFTLPIVDRNGLTGKTLTLSDFLGKVIALEFMGPWCPPCGQLAPFVETLYEQYANRGVVFIGVAEPWDPIRNSEYQNVTITQFLSQQNSSLTYVLDSPTWQVGNTYGLQSVPTLFVLLKTGEVGYTFNGAGVIRGNATAAIEAAQAAQVATVTSETTTPTGFLTGNLQILIVVIVAVAIAVAAVVLLRKKRQA